MFFVLFYFILIFKNILVLEAALIYSCEFGPELFCNHMEGYNDCCYIGKMNAIGEAKISFL